MNNGYVYTHVTGDPGYKPPVNPDLLTQVLRETTNELTCACAKFPAPFGNAHEGYAVLLEEVDEAWDAIKKNDIIHARKEMVQVAAMAIRFLLEVKP